MNRVALVTGASSGIGRALSLRLGAEGWAVGLAARREDRLREAAEEIRGAGGGAAVLPCDVSVRSRVGEAVRRCARELGPVDLLVANAGVSGRTAAESLDADSVERMVRVNFLGAVYAAEAVLPSMRRRGRGRLVAVTSLAGSRGLPGMAAYSASKAALGNFFESLRIDLEGTGVGVTVVVPGYVRTPMTEGRTHAMPFILEADEAARRIHRAVRRGRRRVAFPWPLATLAHLARLFPAGLYDRLVSGAGPGGGER